MPRPPRKFNDQPFAYHQELEIEITSLTNLGLGVGRVDGWVVFVPFTIPGEKVVARVYRNHASHSEADLVAVLHSSPDRVEPHCPLFGECGGCQYQHVAYDAQLEFKRQQVAELLERMAGVTAEVRPPLASPERYHYRSKITPHFQKPRPGQRPDIGFLKAGRRFDIIDVPHCPIASEAINGALPALREEVYRNASFYKKGATLLLRESADGKVLTEPQDVCEDVAAGVRFQFPAGEFFQNNPSLLTAFAEHVAHEAAASGAHCLIDAYCGSGFFCLSAAGRFRQAVGIEISEASIDWAQRNAELNAISNCRFIAGEAANIFAEIEFAGDDTAVVIDPPRKGSNPEFLEQLLRFGPRCVVYVSCNPATQIRDLKPLIEDGRYEITCIQPVDLFPQTRHLECIVTLRRKA